MKTIYYTASTLTGHIADPDHSLAWLLQFPMPGTSYAAFLSTIGAIAMGSTTYQWLLDHHVSPPAGPPQPWPYSQPTWVFTTRTLPPVPGADIRFVQGDPRPVHADIARTIPPNLHLWLVGGGHLAAQFHDHGLLDELILQLAPVTLPAGSPLLPTSITTPPLRLLSVERLDDHFVQLHYQFPRPPRQ